MIRRAALLLLALAPSCAAPPPERQPAAADLPRVCRALPDAGALTAERGIGGTGIAPAAQRTAERGLGGTGIAPAARRTAERGLGCTGIAPAAQRTAERGIGGTGIVGVITGFASVCINGLEVALDDTAQVQFEREPAADSILRAGQLVTIAAEGPGAALRARSIVVRHEVSGPVESMEIGHGDSLVVAGQAVVVLPTTLGRTDILPGDWIAVSGLRIPNGTILATRVDRRARGQVAVRGTPADAGDGTWRIGTLTLHLPPGQATAAGTPVVAAGRYDHGTLHVEVLAADLLAVDPAAYFGAAVQRLVIESYVHFEEGHVRLTGGFEAPAGPAIGAALAHPGLAVVALEREDGSFRVTNMLDAGGRIAVPWSLPWINPPFNPLLGLSHQSEAVGGAPPGGYSGGGAPTAGEAAGPNTNPQKGGLIAGSYIIDWTDVWCRLMSPPFCGLV